MQYYRSLREEDSQTPNQESEVLIHQMWFEYTVHHHPYQFLICLHRKALISGYDTPSRAVENLFMENIIFSQRFKIQTISEITYIKKRIRFSQ